MVGGLAVACAALALLACEDTLTQIRVEDVVELRLSVDQAEVPIGRETRLAAYPLDTSGALLIGPTVTWESADPQVASVDSVGVVTGVAFGSTPVTARIGALAASAVVTVDIAPVLTLSTDSVGYDASVGGGDPAPQFIGITNTGGLTLSGLSVDSTVYAAGASGWVAAQLDSSVGPANLQLSALTSAVTATGVYSALVWLSATNADGSPASIVATLTMAP